jgi:hypothetical protein
LERPDVTDPGVRELVVTGPVKERLFELFTRVYAGRSDVRVIMDRRDEARRLRADQVAFERRRADRRHHPCTWVFPPPD